MISGKEFKAKRIEFGYETRPHLAAAMGVESDTVKKWETDVNPVPLWAEKALARLPKKRKRRR